jgi:hypothetical protein
MFSIRAGHIRVTRTKDGMFEIEALDLQGPTRLATPANQKGPSRLRPTIRPLKDEPPTRRHWGEPKGGCVAELQIWESEEPPETVAYLPYDPDRPGEKRVHYKLICHSDNCMGMCRGKVEETSTTLDFSCECEEVT